MSDRISIVERAPTVEEYQALRRCVGWPEVAPGLIETGLRNALYGVCALDGGALVGCGRVVGDGGIYFYLQDVIVVPSHQGQGVGRRITQALMDYIALQAGENSFVGLMAAEGVAPFYRSFSFVERPDSRPGMFLMWPPV